MITLQNGIHWSHFWCEDIVLNIKRKGIAEAVITKYRGFVNKHQRQKKTQNFYGVIYDLTNWLTMY